MTGSCFVTGTDTACGKTAVSLGLMWALQQRGLRALGMKPVASGSRVTAEGLRNDDALRLQAQGSWPLPYAAVNPYPFEPPIAPHIAAQQAGLEIELARLRRAYRELAAAADAVIVEGVGGWHVPLGPATAIADLVRELDLPVLLVVGLRLGCLNHALLSVESILGSAVPLAGWVATQVERDMRDDGSGRRQDAGICNNNRIRVNIGKFLQIGFDKGLIVIVGKNIAGHINFDTALVGQNNGLLHFRQREITGEAAEGEVFAGEIDGVGTIMDGDLQFFGITGGCE